MSDEFRIDLNEVLIAPDFKEGIATLDPHHGVYRRFAATMKLAEAEVTLDVDVDDQGVATCRRIELSAELVNGELLRRVPVGRLVAAAMTAAHFRFVPRDEPSGGALRIDFGEKIARLPSGAESVEFYERYAQNARRPRRGSPLTEENLRQVADLYRAAMRRGDPPTQTIAQAMHITRSTASRWVAAAREKELLGKALRGRAGEREEER
jgi:hypothetical protein